MAVEPQGGPALTSRKVEDIVSTTSAHLGVRAVMRRVQRRLGAGGCVMEGRDIGTVVFADADVKIFLSAKPRERARRRTRERGQEQAAAVARRDALDSRTNPLEPAPDATTDSARRVEGSRRTPILNRFDLRIGRASIGRRNTRRTE